MCPKNGDKMKISVLELYIYFFRSRINDPHITTKISQVRTDYMKGAG